MLSVSIFTSPTPDFTAMPFHPFYALYGSDENDKWCGKESADYYVGGIGGEIKLDGLALADIASVTTGSDGSSALYFGAGLVI